MDAIAADARHAGTWKSRAADIAGFAETGSRAAREAPDSGPEGARRPTDA